LLALSSLDYDKIVEPDCLQDIDAKLLDIFEDESSLRHQSGKFKIESIHKEAYVRCIKCYYLGATADSDDYKQIKMKGLPR
jgi:hypothetical protein